MHRYIYIYTHDRRKLIAQLGTSHLIRFEGNLITLDIEARAPLLSVYAVITGAVYTFAKGTRERRIAPSPANRLTRWFI